MCEKSNVTIDMSSSNNYLALICQNSNIETQFTKKQCIYLISKDKQKSVYNSTLSVNTKQRCLLDLAISFNYRSMIDAILDEYSNECDIKSALMTAADLNIRSKSDEMLKYILDTNNIIIKSRIIKEQVYAIKSAKYSNNNTMLDIIVSKGRVKQFISVISTLVDICNIEDFESLIKMRIITRENIAKWIKICTNNKYSVFLSFLNNFNEKCFQSANFGIFCVIFDIGSNNSNTKKNSENNEEVNELSLRFNKDYKNARYLFEKCQKSTLKDLSNVVNNGLLKQECGFNDTLLILSKMVDNDSFVKNMSNVTRECLSNEKKTVSKHCFFKNNLLNSNVWSMISNTNTNTNKSSNDSNGSNDSDAVNTSENKSNELENVIDSSLLLFNQIKKDILSNELKTQQMFIQNAIISEEKTNNKKWVELRQLSPKESLLEVIKELESDDELSQLLLPVYYNADELPFDNVNGFDGTKEYDHNIYLTQLLITAHQMNNTFQNECKNTFNKKNGYFTTIPCKFWYNSAPVKTKSRCITKAELDYKYDIWPHTINIKDLLRCSVTFDTIDGLIKGYKQFTNMMYDRYLYGNNAKNISCIKRILRIKNGFSTIVDESWNVKDLSKFDYVDIKFNVLIETTMDRRNIDSRNNKTNNNRNGKKLANDKYYLMGEIQFLAKFMLEAKKMGHSIYSFVRKQDLFEKIYLNCNNYNITKNGKLIENKLRKMIVTQNLTQFSKYFESISKDELKYIQLNKKVLLGFLKQNEWKRGLKLFEIYVK